MATRTKTFRISQRLWDSFTPAEQQTMRRLALDNGTQKVRRFITALRRFEAADSGASGFRATKNGRLYAWSSETGEFYDIGPAPAV